MISKYKLSPQKVATTAKWHLPLATRC